MKSNNESYDDQTQLLFPMAKKPYKVFDQTFQFQHVHYYLSEEIGDPLDYADMIHQIANAGGYDEIYIHFNTPGGRLDTGIQILTAMQNSQAKIIAVLDGMIYSLGTILFLAADEIQVSDNCLIMLHNFSSGIAGKGNELSSQLNATTKWFGELVKQYYIPFLSQVEVERLLKGEDFWMTSTEIRKRLNNIVKIEKEKLQEKAIKKLKKECENI